VEQVQECGGILLSGTSALLTVVFGTSQTLAHLLQQAVQAALTVQHMVVEARALAGGEAVPAVRLTLHCGELLVEIQASAPMVRVLAVGETLALPVRLLGQAVPGEVLVSPAMEPLVQGWCTLQALGARPPDQLGAYRLMGLTPHLPSGA
jgi:class 3 adenylate cyclase